MNIKFECARDLLIPHPSISTGLYILIHTQVYYYRDTGQLCTVLHTFIKCVYVVYIHTLYIFWRNNNFRFDPLLFRKFGDPVLIRLNTFVSGISLYGI